MNSNGTRFGFLNAVGDTLKKMNEKVNRIIDNFNNEKLYVIDYNDLVEEYHQLGLGDIDEFCSNYVFSRHLGRPHDSPESREAMYLEVRDFLWDLKENGHLD